MAKLDIIVPADVPQKARDMYVKNYETITSGVGRLMLFAGDQRIEHLNDDFYGEDISPEDNDPAHLFEIATRSKIGVFATQLGNIARYGPLYPDLPYLAKLNSKSHLVKTAQRDPISKALWDVDDVIDVRESSGLNILGVGYTLYLGSEYEHVMMKEAAEVIFDAHRKGMVAVVWCYPRGKAVPNEKDPHLIAGAAAVAGAIGADFVKVNLPKKEGHDPCELLKEAVETAGTTKLVCAGGSSMDVRGFLELLHDQIHVGGSVGNATGRNVHQKPLREAVAFCNAIHAIVVEDKSVDEAMKIYEKGK